MEKENIVLLVSIVTPLAGAIATIVPVLKATFSNRKQVMEKMELIARNVSRLIMHDEALSLPERIQAGEEYRANKGNGASEQYLEILEEQYRRELLDSGKVG
jgi:hypothetical protein